jgi:hypothetical protein
MHTYFGEESCFKAAISNKNEIKGERYDVI